MRFKVTKVQINDVSRGEAALNDAAGNDYNIAYAVVKDAFAIVFLEKAKGPGRPPKKAE